MAWTATHRFARIADRKARLVVDVIRGRPCNEALEVLRFMQQRAARQVNRVLKAAMASANEAEASMGKLYVREARVDAGPTLKRWHPKDRGRAHPIAKRTSHITIRLAEA